MCRDVVRLRHKELIENLYTYSQTRTWKPAKKMLKGDYDRCTVDIGIEITGDERAWCRSTAGEFMYIAVNPTGFL